MRKATFIVGALIGAVALMLLPLAWVKVLGSPTSKAAGDPLNLITAAATVMGGILVAGGLVALLGSIGTFLAIEDKVKGLLDKEVQKIEQGVYANIQNFYQVTRTIHQDDWRLALRETDRMLEETGEIPGARFELAERLFTDVVKAYRLERDCEEVTGYLEPDDMPFRGVPTGEAWARLEAASQRKEGPPGRANALLGLLGGYSGTWASMWEWLLKPVGDENACLRHRHLLRKPYHIAMLCGVCDTKEKLEVIGKELGIALPMRWDVVDRSLKLVENGVKEQIGWWVWRSPEECKRHPRLPFPRAFTIKRATPLGAQATAYYLTVTGAEGVEPGIGYPPEWGGGVVGVDQLKDLCFLCPTDEAIPYAPDG